MNHLLFILAWPLLITSGFAILLWSVVFMRFQRALRDDPSIRRGCDIDPPASDGRPPTLSIIVPAHNEQRVIDDCCASLRAQTYESLELIFVLDRCTDGTLDILQRHAADDDRIVIVDNNACPDDWAGKCHAAHLGAEQATGDWLLFTDADTAFDPDLASASVALAADRGLSLVSILSTLTYGRAFEQIAQSAATLFLMRLYPIDRVNDAQRPRPFANGQFLLFSREAYDAVGGHAAVKDDLLEDIAFARAIRDSKRRGGIFLSDRMLTCSMYDSFDSFRLGWKRIFIEACRRKIVRLKRNATTALLMGVVLPILLLIGLAVGAALIATAHDPPLGWTLTSMSAVAAALQLVAIARHCALGGAPRWTAILFPFGCWVVTRIMFEGARDLAERRPIPWAGKTYTLDPRD
jgi:glycosyltransferase involved in cell wall biosynthesis